MHGYTGFRIGLDRLVVEGGVIVVVGGGGGDQLVS
jgi:hypothetical protein